MITKKPLITTAMLIPSICLVQNKVISPTPCTWAQRLQCMGLFASQPVGSSWTRDQTHILLVGWQILYH